jgi:hypothetical protein
MQNPPDMKLRISAALRHQIEEAAKINNRTMNSEVIARLEQSFDKQIPRLSFLKKAQQSATGYSDHENRLAQLENQLETLKKCLAGAGIDVPDD